MTTAVSWSHERGGGWERTASLLLAVAGWCVHRPKAEPTEPCKHPNCFLQSSPIHSYILVLLGHIFHGWKQDVAGVGAHTEGYYDSILTSEGALEDSGCPDSLASERW